MGYYTQNIITIFESETDEDIIAELKTFFPLAKVKEFNSDFHGIVAQVERSRLIRDSAIDDMQELEEELAIIDERMIEFTKRFPERIFVSIDVNCFGGICSYEGFSARNGIIILAQESTEDGHITLLKSIFPKYERIYFEPFTRDFFVRKGKIDGVIQDFSLGGLFIGFNSEYTDTSLYRIESSSNFLFFERKEEYYLLFESEEKTDDIKVSGVIYNDDKEILREIEDHILSTFSVMTHSIAIYMEGILEPRRFANKVEHPIRKRKSFWLRWIG
ncbi:hypothetical protein DLM75_11505 [Leptospira stimsonii]|uniref:Uncharacterized protein n=1 Tax=Leptospira stimsonii TaxID=2202203 RepID=A0A396Z4D0_9LEPT|nr:hypothetical protein DLM75_11505 [Leptospira stimsonii]